MTVPDARAERVVESLLAAAPRLGDTRLLCIDGPSGSGKTTLAGEVVALLSGEAAPVADVWHLSMDDHYDGWQGLDDVDVRLREQVLEPLAAGEPGMYRRYDWEAQEFAELHLVPPVDVLVLEGVGSGSRLLAAYCSLLVWMDAPRAVRRRRALGRDGDAYAPHWESWAAAESAHFAAHETPARADVCLGPDRTTPGHSRSR